MLRNAKFLNSLGILDGRRLICTTSSSLSRNGTGVRTSRPRKPSWAQIAGTKLHRVTVRKVEPAEEYAEFKTMYQNYRSVLKSLRFQFLEELEAKEAAKASASQVIAEDTNRMEHVRKMNEEWNRRSAELRKSHEAEEIKVKEQEFEDLKRQVDEAKAARKAEAKKQVEKLKAEVPNFIDISRLDDAIEESLNKRSVFNFFIDKEGWRYVENLDGSLSAFDQDGNLIVSSDPIPAKPPGIFQEDNDSDSDSDSDGPNGGTDDSTSKGADEASS